LGLTAPAISRKKAIGMIRIGTQYWPSVSVQSGMKGACAALRISQPSSRIETSE